jgi:hypothetical protein
VRGASSSGSSGGTTYEVSRASIPDRIAAPDGLSPPQSFFIQAFCFSRSECLHRSTPRRPSLAKNKRAVFHPQLTHTHATQAPLAQ